MTRPFYRSLYVQVLAGIVLGVVVGIVWPDKGAAMKPLGDGFIKLIKMLIAPIVFATITVGIARMGAMRDVGRIGIRTLLYFEAVSTLALVIGLVVVNILQPGRGLHVDPAEETRLPGLIGCVVVGRPLQYDVGARPRGDAERARRDRP